MWVSSILFILVGFMLEVCRLFSIWFRLGLKYCVVLVLIRVRWLFCWIRNVLIVVCRFFLFLGM